MSFFHTTPVGSTRTYSIEPPVSSTENFSTASDNLSANYSRSQLIKDKIGGKSNDKTASRLDS